MSLINISLCLTDLKEKCPEKIKKAENGRYYVNLCLGERKEIGKYGETHTLFVSQTKEEREFNVETVYVGSGREYRPNAVTAEDIEKAPAAPLDENDDLPF
jgi:hypothetical protein